MRIPHAPSRLLPFCTAIDGGVNVVSAGLAPLHGHVQRFICSHTAWTQVTAWPSRVNNVGKFWVHCMSPCSLLNSTAWHRFGWEMPLSRLKTVARTVFEGTWDAITGYRSSRIDLNRCLSAVGCGPSCLCD
jgi:hypothetical protein